MTASSSRIVFAWIVLFLAFDTVVKVFKSSVAVEGTTRLGYPEVLPPIHALMKKRSVVSASLSAILRLRPAAERPSSGASTTILSIRHERG
jgi:hypothetical protein